MADLWYWLGFGVGLAVFMAAALAGLASIFDAWRTRR